MFKFLLIKIYITIEQYQDHIKEENLEIIVHITIPPKYAAIR